MTAELTPPPENRRLTRNSMAFPRELRDAISRLHDAQMLDLGAINGGASHWPWSGRQVELRLQVSHSGAHPGEYTVHMGLQPEAARELASILTRLADEADQLPPAPPFVP